jgi:hypothetical protein
MKRSLVACPRPAWLWKHLLTGYSADSHENRPYRVIETTDGRPMGYVGPGSRIERQSYLIGELALTAGQTWRTVAPTILRALVVIAKDEAATQGKEVNSKLFNFGPDHPLLQAVSELDSTTRRPYAWYVRVADVPAFVRRVAPALATRLADSPMCGQTGEVKISEFKGGFRFVFERGRLVASELWKPADGEENARFPPLALLQLLFGSKSIAELRDFYADAWAKDEADALLDTLFPKRGSVVIPVGCGETGRCDARPAGGDVSPTTLPNARTQVPPPFARKWATQTQRHRSSQPKSARPAARMCLARSASIRPFIEPKEFSRNR